MLPQGRYFTDAENTNAMRVAFIGQDVADKLFPQGGAYRTGDHRSAEFLIAIIGIQIAKGTVFGQPQDALSSCRSRRTGRTSAVSAGAVTCTSSARQSRMNYSRMPSTKRVL